MDQSERSIEINPGPEAQLPLGTILEEEKMKWKVSALIGILQAQFPGAEAQSFGLLDPKLCYLLDGILFIYGVIVTALYLRAKFSGSVGADANQQGSNQIYNELNLGRREEYDVLNQNWAGNPETGGKEKKRNPQEGVYNALQKNQMAGAYSEIRVKQKRQKDKGHNDLYQGLSAATKDTYDALHMQTLPPR
ncbi:T-cell surface glycoprotein CD3 zeta chain [Chionomys nivalis]|uniref:T-cell surface glycoprotein CD3 zeta chain n=1 Tax=Chionomys nivalis TaxID=269649 RepID=UPI00259A5E34|nr:T-cell surface glycoprotein CD3 zeta chain [Chionomys nivalis]